MNKVLLFAMPLWIMEVTGSAVVLSLYHSAVVLTSILVSPVSGIFSDRINKVKIIKSGNVLKLLSVFLIFLLFQEPEKNVYLIISEGAYDTVYHYLVSLCQRDTKVSKGHMKMI